MLRHRITSQLRILQKSKSALATANTSKFRQDRYQSSSGTGDAASPDYAKFLGIAAIAASAGAIYYMKRPDAAKKTTTGGKLDEEEEEELDDDLTPPEIVLGLPEHIPYLIVGAGTSAFAAYRAIRSKDATARVMLVGDEKHLPYMRPPLSKEIWYSENAKDLKFKQWNGKERSVFFEKDAYYCKPEELTKNENGGVSVITGVKVIKLDLKTNTASLNTGQSVKFDKLLLAPGGRPKHLPVIEQAGKDVKRRTTLFRNINDFQRLFDKTADKSMKSIAIVGGGFMGSELACALGKRGKETGVKVTQVYPDKGNMGRILPSYLSKWSTEKVKEEGVEIITESHITGCEFNKKSKKVELTLTGDKKLSVDHVVVAVGLEPNVDLAREAGLEVSESHGGYLVNAELEARSNIFVAGDAACFYDVSLGRRRVEHHDHAVVSGRLAGGNMAAATSADRRSYGHQSMFWSDLGPDVGYEAIGVVDSSLKTTGVYASSDGKAQDGKSGDYGKGVIFYTYEKRIVGIVLWNVFNKIDIARKLISDTTEYENLEEVAKLFQLYGDADTEKETTSELPKVPA